MSYELQIYALSPVRPSVAELLGQASASGLTLEQVGQAAGRGDAWTALALRAVGEDGAAFTVEVSPELESMQESFRADRATGDTVPDEVLDASVLYLLESGDDEGDDEAASEAQLAAFVVAAWALATLSDGVVFDPQEELFADAESFWALVMDDDGEGGEGAEIDGDETEDGDMTADPRAGAAPGEGA